MNSQKMLRRVLDAIVIIGGVEGAAMRCWDSRDLAIITSIIAMAVIIIGAYLIEK